MNSKEFLDRYLGMLVGVAIALVAIAFGFVKVLVYVALIIASGWLGKYVQDNKEVVKEKLKSIIDKF